MENRTGKVSKKIMVTIALILLGYCMYQLTSTYLGYKQAEDEYRQVEKQFVTENEMEQHTELGMDTDTNQQPTEKPIDFAGLKEINPDIIGWIKINAIDISYPVMQSQDNEYYLHHTFEGDKHFAGSIYADFRNKADFSDANTIIYGHNMKNGSMFGKLKKFRSQKSYDREPYLFLYTPDKIYQYEIFSCREVELNSSAYQLQFESEKEFAAYIKGANSKSLIKTEGGINDISDNIITLSTCTSNDEARLIVQGICVAVYYCQSDDS